MNNPKELLKEFVRLTKSEDPAKKQMAQIYESYMVKGCYELAKFDMAVQMIGDAQSGHIQEMGKDLAKVSTPKEWDEQGGAHNLGTDEGLYSFINKAQETGGIENTLLLMNHLGMNDKAMQLEMKNIGELEELKSALNPQTLGAVIKIVQNKANFVGGLNLTKAPKEAKLREQYLTQLNSLIEYINENAPKLLTQAQAQA